MVGGLSDYGCNLYVHDLITKLGDAWRKYGITLNKWEELPRYVDAMVATASHAEYFAQCKIILLDKLKSGSVFIDFKSSHSPEAIKSVGASLWRL